MKTACFQQIYCEISFLKELYDYLGSHFASDEIYESRYLIFKNLINRQCEIWLDVKPENIVELGHSNPYFKILWKNSTQGGARLNDYSNIFPYLLKELKDSGFKPNSLYLHNQNSTISNKALLELNLLNSNNNNLKIMSKDIFISESLTVSSEAKMNTFEGWSFLDKIDLPVTDIIIADNYILKEFDEINFNLLNILNHIIKPSLCSKDLNIMITVKKDSLSQDALVKRIQLLNSSVSKIVVNRKCNIGIYEVRKETLHDRNIITNYLWINSGHSFDYLNKRNKLKSNKNTNLEISCVGLWGNKEAGIIEQLRRIRNGCLADNSFMGVERNRILT